MSQGVHSSSASVQIIIWIFGHLHQEKTNATQTAQKKPRSIARTQHHSTGWLGSTKSHSTGGRNSVFSSVIPGLFLASTIWAKMRQRTCRLRDRGNASSHAHVLKLLTIFIDFRQHFLHLFLSGHHPEVLHDEKQLIRCDRFAVINIEDLEGFSEFWSTEAQGFYSVSAISAMIMCFVHAVYNITGCFFNLAAAVRDY